MSATCTREPTAHEALLVMKGSPAYVLADVTNAAHPQVICTITGSAVPQLVTQRMISWSATQTPGAGECPIRPGASRCLVAVRGRPVVITRVP